MTYKTHKPYKIISPICLMSPIRLIIPKTVKKKKKDVRF